MQRLYGIENLVGRRMTIYADLELVREYVEQHLGVGVGAEVPAVFARQQIGKFVVIREVAVMCQADAVGRVDVERLRLGGFRATGRRVANVTDTHVARQTQHVARVEHVTHEAVGPALLQALLAPGDDARGILTAVLHHRQAVVERLVDGIPANDSDNAAHASLHECYESARTV